MRVLAALMAITFCLMAEDAPTGIPARPSASDYAVQAQWQNATFAASLVPAKQVEHLFAFDISKTFVVFEVACYAGDASPLKISRQSFVVKVDASGDSIQHTEAETVASAIQRKNLPPMPEIGSNTGVNTWATIGVAHGNDPYTGRPATGVYTAGGATVEQGRGANSAPPRDVKPGGTYEDRKVLESQLRAHSLPEGAVNRAVAGYLFFRKSDLKAQGGDAYALEYLADSDGSGATHAVMIAVPHKSH